MRFPRESRRLHAERRPDQLMASNDDLGKGPSRPGDIPGARRPYATIDAKATEIDSKPQGSASSASANPKSQSQGEGKQSDAKANVRDGSGASPRTFSTLLGPTGTAPLSHIASGAVGAVLVLLATLLLPWDRTPVRSPELSDVSRRLAELESSVGARPNAGLRGRIEEMSRSVSALGDEQARLAREAKALETKLGSTPALPPELAGRIAKLEETLAALSSATQSGQPPQVAALAVRVGEIDKAAREAGEAAKANAARLEGEIGAVRTEAGRIGQRIDGLRMAVEDRLKSVASASAVAQIDGKVSALERDLQSLQGTEAERKANTSRVVLGLELANLKRAVDRGDSYRSELAQVKKVAGSSLDLSALDRYSDEGVPTLQTLTKSFRKTANAMIEAEAQPADAGIFERLMAGARDIVRVRKAGHATSDMSVEAVVGRMDAALKEGRLGEVLAQAKTLPPKAELAGEDWVKKVAARHAVDQALAQVEAALKTSLGSATPDAKR
jgi:hypothetical protein